MPAAFPHALQGGVQSPFVGTPHGVFVGPIRPNGVGKQD